jgi:DNA-binding winged helix-turn-helix (wHTH) protein
MSPKPLPFPSLTDQLLGDLEQSRCASVTGLSNTGKSSLMRSLAGSEAPRVPKGRRGQPGLRIYVDCNQAVALSPQALCEIVLRSVLERVNTGALPDLATSLRRHHQSISEAASAFSASLSFNLALTELCEGLGRPLCLLIDEFDEIYACLDERSLLNLRAIKDRFDDRLVYVTATVRPLPALRGGQAEDEFAELFSASTYLMPPLTTGEINRFLDELKQPQLTPERRRVCHQLSGGHPGLLRAVSRVLAALPEEWTGHHARAVSLEPGPLAECLKIWTQLTANEQADLLALASGGNVAAAPKQLHRLESLGLVREGAVFSTVFADFVARRGRVAQVEPEGIYLDSDSGDVWVDGMRIPVLTDLEFRLLQLLYERRDKLTDKYRIVTAVWGEDYLGDVDDARVEKLVSRLRAHVEHDPANPRYLITQRGRGYKLLSRPRTG